MCDVRKYGTLDVPMHLRNASTKLMKEIGYGKDYRYAHNEEGAYAANQAYLPEELKSMRYYRPTDRGLELKIRQYMDRLRNKIQNKE